MYNKFTLHCITWQAGAPLLQQVRAAACKAGLLSQIEAQPDEMDERCRHVLALSKDGECGIGSARISPNGDIDRMVILPRELESERRILIETVMTELLNDYVLEMASTVARSRPISEQTDRLAA
jgi:hypothetical protein